MKNSVVFIISILCSSLINAQDLIIQAGGTTYKFPDPGQCMNSNCIKGIIRTTELAGPALAADVNALKAEAVKADADLAKLDLDYTQAHNQYSIAIVPYEYDVDKYNTDNDSYKSDLASHNARAIANNNLPADQRSQAEVNWLIQNKARLDQWLDKLNTWKVTLDAKRDPLVQQWQTLELKRGELKVKASAAADLQRRISLLMDQLQKCDDFSKRAVLIANKKGWGNYNYANDFFGTFKVLPGIALLNGWSEQMKKWASRQWD